MASKLALGGLVSGAGTEDMIQKLLDIERAKIKVQEKQRTTYETQQASWTKVKEKLTALRSKLDGIRFSSAYQARKVAYSTEGVVGVTATAGATKTTHALTITKLAQAHQQVSKDMADPNATLGLAADETLTIKGVDVSVATTDTLYTLRDKINSAGAGATADVIQVMRLEGGTWNTYHQLSVTSQTEGESGALNLTQAGGSTLLTTLNMTDAKAAQDAQFRLNGNDYKKGSNTVAGVLPNLTLNLTKVGSTEFTISHDADATVTAVQGWVDALNETLTLLKDESAVNVASSTYGTLSKEPLARQLQQALRGMLSSVAAGQPAELDSLDDIGITTGAYGTSDYGKVMLDTNKLKTKLLSDPDGVSKVLGATASTAETGAAGRMYTYVNSALLSDGPLDLRGDALAERVGNINDTISRMNTRMEERETELRAMFTRMELAMAKLQSQGTALMSTMFGGMAKS